MLDEFVMETEGTCQSAVYDVGTYGQGRLTGASDVNHTLTWSYDGLGRVTSKAQAAGGVNKTVGYIRLPLLKYLKELSQSCGPA
jgi:YD repeat-containing protein